MTPESAIARQPAPRGRCGRIRHERDDPAAWASALLRRPGGQRTVASSAARTTGAEPISRPHVSASAMSAANGTTTVHDSRSRTARTWAVSLSRRTRLSIRR